MLDFTHKEISSLINETIEGISNSRLGPIFLSDPNDLRKKSLNQIAWAAFPIIVNYVFTNYLKNNTDGEEWKK